MASKGILLGCILWIYLYFPLFTGSDILNIHIQSWASNEDNAEGYIKLNGTPLAFNSSEVTRHKGAQVVFLDKSACRILHQIFITSSNTTKCGSLYEDMLQFLPKNITLLLSSVQSLGRYVKCVELLMETLLNHSYIKSNCPSGMLMDNKKRKAVAIIAVTGNVTLCSVNMNTSSLTHQLEIPDSDDSDPNCDLGDSWTTWSMCTWYRNGEKQLRYRMKNTVTGTPEMDTRDCDNYITEGEWTVYGEWAACSESCGQGFQTRRRTCFGWEGRRLECDGSAVTTRQCEGFECIEDEYVIPEETFTEADRRESAKTSGTFAIIFISVFFSLIILSDVTTFRVQYPIMAYNLRYAFSKVGRRENRWRVQVTWKEFKRYLGFRPRLATFSGGFDFKKNNKYARFN